VQRERPDRPISAISGYDGVPKDQLEVVSDKPKKDKRKKKKRNVAETYDEEEKSEIRERPPPIVS
jgi:hypothetical protein